jgi:hypothetical protein
VARADGWARLAMQTRLMTAYLHMSSGGWLASDVLLVLFWTLTVWVVATLAGRLWTRRRDYR